MSEKFRLVTRSDFDGLACAVLLEDLGIIDEVKFVHPKDMQDGKVEVNNNDIIANIPYAPGAYLAFDHHISETIRITDNPENHILDADAPSAARLIYNYFGGSEKFHRVSNALLDAVDKADAGRFTPEEILYPSDWVLLNFIMDPRTGLGRFREFKISNYQLMIELIDACLNLPVAEILKLPDVQERVELYRAHEDQATQQIKRCAKVYDNLVVIDLRAEAVIYATNRFIVYALFPHCSMSVHIMWGLKQQKTVFATGKNILDRSSPINVGKLMLNYGGGGHIGAGTCQVENDQSEAVLAEMIGFINAEG